MEAVETEKLNELIKNAIDFETKAITKQPGSEYEAYAYIKEQIEEAFDDITLINEDLIFMWNTVKGNSDKAYKSSVEHIRLLAHKLITDGIMIAAVTNKAGIEK